MALALFQLNISRVDGPLFAGTAAAVSIPAVSGELQILANHEPLITPIVAGTIRVTKESGETKVYTVTAGTLEASNNQVTILV